jgi:hypothetical protein
MKVFTRLKDALHRSRDIEDKRGPDAAFHAAIDARDHDRFRAKERERRGRVGMAVRAAVEAVSSAKRMYASSDKQVLVPQWFGVTGDGVTNNAAGLQSMLTTAMNASANPIDAIPIVIPGSTLPYRCDSSLTWFTAQTTDTGGPIILGGGRYATQFDNRAANAPLFDIANTTGAAHFIRGGYIKDLQIITTTNPVSSSGIRVRAWWQFHIENVQVIGLTGSGFIIDVRVGDPDGCTEVIIENCWFQGCNYGIQTTNVTTAIEISWIILRGTYCQSNKLAGMSARALGILLDHSAFTLNAPLGSGGAGGLQIRGSIDNVTPITASNTGRDFIARQCDFENNGVCHLDIQTGIQTLVHDTNFLWTSAATGGNYPISFGVKLGGSQIPAGSYGGPLAVQYADIENSFVRNLGQNNYVQFALGDDSSFISIRHTRWDQGSPTGTGSARFQANTGVAPYTGGTLLPDIEDDGWAWQRPVNTNPSPGTSLTPPLVPGGTYTPDPSKFGLHLLILTSPGPYAIALPNYSMANNSLSTIGLVMRFLIINNSGGLVEISFNSQYILEAYSDPLPTSGNNYRFLEFMQGQGGFWHMLSVSQDHDSLTVSASPSPNTIPGNQTGIFSVPFAQAKIGDVVLATPAAISQAVTWSSYVYGRQFLDAAITAGSVLLNSATANFTTADLNTTVTVNGAGPGGLPLIATITGTFPPNTATQVSLSIAATTTVTGALALIQGLVNVTVANPYTTPVGPIGPTSWRIAIFKM